MKRKSEFLKSFGKMFEIVKILVNAVLDMGGSDEDLERIQKDPELVKKLAALIVNVTKHGFKVWKTIKLGTVGIKTPDNFRAAFQLHGNKIGDWANDILGKSAFTAATEATEVDLVVVSVAELGFKNGATYRDICQKAKELGLDLCPAEVGPQLRLQYQDQPMGEWLIIAMEAISDSSGDLSVFYVARGVDGLWLSSSYGRPGRSWVSDRRFVFLRRK